MYGQLGMLDCELKANVKNPKVMSIKSKVKEVTGDKQYDN